MLPSTGYFKSINCPFYDNSVCDRPYCHFKHLRREDASTAPTISTQATEGYKNSETTTTTTTSAITSSSSSSSLLTIPQTKSEIIQQLVSEAVTKVLVDQGVSDTDKVSENIVSKVVEGLKPKLAPTISTIGKHSGVPQSITKPPCIYNPTPISELKKRHNLAIPFYNPTIRDCKIPVKRKSNDEWSSSTTTTTIINQKNELTYKPTAINNDIIIHDYIPTVKFDSNLLLNTYDDSNSSSDYNKRKETYCPKVKKRREEYVPKKIKTPLQSVVQYDDTTTDGYDNNDFHTYESNNIIIDKKINITEGKFSDDDDDDDDKKKDSEITAKEVQNTIKTVVDDDKSIVVFNKSNSSKISKDNDKTSSRRNSSNSSDQGHKSSESEKKKLDKENSKNHSDKNKKEHSSLSKTDDKKNSKDHKYSGDRHKSSSSSSSSRHTSSSSSKSKSSSKSSHRDKESSSSSSSHHRSKDKSHSSRHKKSSSKENENDKSSSRNDKHTKSSNSSSKSDKSSSRSSDKKKSSSSRDKKSSSKNSNEKNKNGLDNEEDNLSNDYFDSCIDELLETSDSEHDVEEECLKIFQEYQESDHPRDVVDKKSLKNHQTEEENEGSEEVGKKRVAHPSAATCSLRNPGPSQPLKKRPNPQEKMYERWRLMKEAAAATAAEKTNNVRASNVQEESENDIFISTKSQQVVGKAKIESKSIHVEPQVNGNARMRIAHVPYAMSLALTKKKVTESAVKPVEPKTVAQTTKGGPRVAHVPQVVPQLIRPEPLQVTTQKFHLNVRQYYVNLMQDICVQIYTNGDDAAQRALREELACHERCKALSVYKNSCMLAAHRLRKEVDPTNNTGPSASGMVSHDAVLAGRGKGTWSVVKTKKAITNFKGSALYSMLKKWIMTEQNLRDWGFPRLHPDGPKGRAKVYTINTRNQSIVSKVPNERYCSRCNQSYMVDEYGLAVRQQNCIYHWGRKYTVRGEGKYSCCQQYGSASGCCDAKNHVWDIVDYENLRGYVQTLPKDIPAEEQGVYALDCEMSYTTQGLELTRITVIDEDCKVIYEALVKPDNPIIDYNTRFSGITEENLRDVTTTLRDVQATLLTMFSDRTIIVGHSLDSDFKALKVIHNTIVDTSMMFPHKNGFPQKRALRNLCSDFLRKIIQSDVNGHDSKEDAVACMELIQWKVKEEAKLQ